MIDPACGEGVFLECALERGVQQVVDIAPEPLERISRHGRARAHHDAEVVDYSRAESSSHRSQKV